MLSDRDAAILREIFEQIGLARQFTDDTDAARFETDVLRLYAVTRCLEIISEASRRLSDDLKKRHPEVPWKEIAGAGNIYRHSYEDVSATRVWDTVQSSLPILRAVVAGELGIASNP